MEVKQLLSNLVSKYQNTEDFVKVDELTFNMVLGGIEGIRYLATKGASQFKRLPKDHPKEFAVLTGQDLIEFAIMGKCPFAYLQIILDAEGNKKTYALLILHGLEETGEPSHPIRSRVIKLSK